jgi:hypothetical protein
MLINCRQLYAERAGFTSLGTAGGLDALPSSTDTFHHNKKWTSRIFLDVQMTIDGGDIDCCLDAQTTRKSPEAESTAESDMVGLIGTPRNYLMEPL